MVRTDLSARTPRARAGVSNHGRSVQRLRAILRHARSFATARLRMRFVYGIPTGPLVTTRSFQSCAGVPARSSLPAT